MLYPQSTRRVPLGYSRTGTKGTIGYSFTRRYTKRLLEDPVLLARALYILGVCVCVCACVCVCVSGVRACLCARECACA